MRDSLAIGQIGLSNNMNGAEMHSNGQELDEVEEIVPKNDDETVSSGDED